MQYQKITLELIVDSHEVDAVIADLNSALDRMNDTHAIFGGDFETTPVEHSGTRKKSVLDHTHEAGKAAASAAKSASRKIVHAYRRVV